MGTTNSLGSLHSPRTTLTGSNFFIILSLDLPSSSLKPFPLVKSHQTLLKILLLSYSPLDTERLLSAHPRASSPPAAHPAQREHLRRKAATHCNPGSPCPWQSLTIELAPDAGTHSHPKQHQRSGCPQQLWLCHGLASSSLEHSGENCCHFHPKPALPSFQCCTRTAVTVFFVQ